MIQTVILCGGKGERLRPLTADLPKPLVPINGKPLLGHIVDHAQAHGVKEFIAAVGYKAEKIKAYLADDLGLAVELVDSGDADIVKRLADCAPFIKGDCLVLYGDTLSDVNLADLAAFHRSRPEKVTITVWPLRSQFGVLDVNADGKVVSFQEKPSLDKWINIGYFYFAKEALPWLAGFATFQDFLVHLVARGELNAYRHKGVHITVNTIKELQEAEENIGRFQGIPK